MTSSPHLIRLLYCDPSRVKSPRHLKETGQFWLAQNRAKLAETKISNISGSYCSPTSAYLVCSTHPKNWARRQQWLHHSSWPHRQQSSEVCSVFRYPWVLVGSKWKWSEVVTWPFLDFRADHLLWNLWKLSITFPQSLLRVQNRKNYKHNLKEMVLRTSIFRCYSRLLSQMLECWVRSCYWANVDEEYWSLHSSHSLPINSPSLGLLAK